MEIPAKETMANYLQLQYWNILLYDSGTISRKEYLMMAEKIRRRYPIAKKKWVLSGTHFCAFGTSPPRRRGCVCDQEAGFYYLNSRYDDPASGRVIGADDYPLERTSMRVIPVWKCALCGRTPGGSGAIFC